MPEKAKEAIILVDSTGAVKRFSATKERNSDEYTAVVLILVYLPKERQLVLFNRGAGASDMNDHWALTAGKLNSTDTSGAPEAALGKPLSLETFRNAAAREFKEELDIVAPPERFEFVTQFHMPEKGLYFTLMAWALEKSDLAKFRPDGKEVDELRCFTMREFDTNQHLGDAIRYRKGEIVAFLAERFDV